MGTLENPPLLEAIFEVHWGERSPGEFYFSDDDHALFAGKVSAAASEKGYGKFESLKKDGTPPFPNAVTHRFRKTEGSWPCFQVGLGVFTVNQIANGYSWEKFLDTIKEGLEIFDKAGPFKLRNESETLTFILRYQDAFFNDGNDKMATYLADTFHINISLPDKFIESNLIKDTECDIRSQFILKSDSPKSDVVVKFSNALIQHKPGILFETLVVSRWEQIKKESICIEDVIDWAESAHSIQKHAFTTLINKKAYK